MEPKITVDDPECGIIEVDMQSEAVPLDSFKLLCVSVVSAFVGWIVTWEIVDTKQMFTRVTKDQPNFKQGNSYECEIR